MDDRAQPAPPAPYLDASTAEFPQRLLSLGRALGDLQFFATDRIGDYHAWARVDGGELTRAYCYVGDHGDVPLHLGERTGVEVELGVGDRWLEDGWESWDESEWDAWHDSMPNEEDVLRVARSWGMSPVDIAEDSVTAPGILGLPPGISPRKGARERT